MNHGTPLSLTLPLLLLASTGCQHYSVCGPGTLAVRGDGGLQEFELDGRGRYVDQDGVLSKARGGVICETVTPPTVCGPGTVMVANPSWVLINPDGSGRYVDQDGSGRYLDQDGSGRYVDIDGTGRYVDQDGSGRWVDQDATVRASRVCLMGELVPDEAGG